VIRAVLCLTALLAGPVGAEETWQRPGGDAYVEGSGRLPVPSDVGMQAWPLSVRLSGQTDRYAHDVLGGIPRWSVLEVAADFCDGCPDAGRATLPASLVFEDVAPRLWNVTGDARPEIVTVESHIRHGSRLVVWSLPTAGDPGKGSPERIAATRFIGAPNRWLAPAAAADFDGDGRIEIAYVDRPHLMQELVFVRRVGGRLIEVVRVPGLTNHRIGDTTITATLRDCGGVTEVILPDAGWTGLRAVRLVGGKAVVRTVTGEPTAKALAAAAGCG